jgi:hypothetical protein
MPVVFLRLPAEILLKNYNLLFRVKSDKAGTVSQCTKRNQGSTSFRTKVPDQFLSTCKQTYTEGQDIFDGEKEFYTYTHVGLRAEPGLTFKVGERSVSMIRKIQSHAVLDNKSRMTTFIHQTLTAV